VYYLTLFLRVPSASSSRCIALDRRVSIEVRAENTQLKFHWSVAQLVEREVVTLKVVGSIPTTPAKFDVGERR